MEAACKGKKLASGHPMVEIGVCAHEVGGATSTYVESGCPDCGALARRMAGFAYVTGGKAVGPTVDNCLALKWRFERAAKIAEGAAS